VSQYRGAMETDAPVIVAIVNDYEVVVRGVHGMLAPYADRVRVVEVGVGTTVVHRVDITLYDTFSATQVDGGEIDDLLSSPDPGAVVAYSWNMHPRLVEIALAKGCRGYLDKGLNAAHLVRALERVSAGEVVVSPCNGTDDESGPGYLQGDWPGRSQGLSSRESEIVSLITQGLTNNDIASRTYLSINSVKTYIRSAYRKMAVTRRSQAVRWGLEHGMSPRVMRDLTPQLPEEEQDISTG
jgi:DNA-binding NarL/FixJ family response regulator